MIEKKCLVISVNCISETTCNGKTVRNILSDFDESNVSVFYTYNELPDFKNRYHLYRITDKDIVKYKLFHRTKCGELITSNAETSAKITNKKIYFENLKRLVRDILWSGSKWRMCGLTEFITESAPDFILFLGINNPYLYRLCIDLQKEKNIPVLIYLTDDYLCSRLSLSPSYWLRLKTLRHCFKRLANNSKTQLITINEIMKEYYYTKFKVDSVVLTNYIDSIYRDYRLRKDKEKKHIVYVGNLLHNRWKSIIQLSNLLEEDNMYVIDVYPGTSINDDIRKAFSSHKNIVIGNNLNANEVKKVHLEADFLLHVESFSYQDCCLARLSLSTKITEYAAACKPIIAFCPQSVASYRILKENNLAVCLTNKSGKCDLDFLKNESYLAEIVKNAYYYFNDLKRKYDMDHLIVNEVCRMKMNEVKN